MANCVNANLENPCDIQSESFLNTIFVKSLIRDSSSHCGYSLQFNNPTPPTKSLSTMMASNHTLLKFEDGRVKAWGDGTLGQLGYNNNKNIADGAAGNLTIQQSAFLPITETVTQLAEGDVHSCALLSSGNVRCWGEGADGRLGYNSTDAVGDGVALSIEAAGNVPIGEKVIQISLGTVHSCALLARGAVRCWGRGDFGQLGYNDTQAIGDGFGPSIQTAGDVPLGGTATQISTGDQHTCALMSNQAVRCWGGNGSGQLGYNNTTQIGAGGQTIIDSGDIPLGGLAIQITSGASHSCALLNNGAMRCWGEGADGNLGYNASNNIGDSAPSSIITTGDVPTGGIVKQITAGFFHTCALYELGNVRCWGDGSSGQLGNNTNTNIGDGFTPSIIASGDINLGGKATQISAGSSHTCALLDTGSVRCWGNGGSGRLGYNSTSNIANGTGLTILQAGDIILE
ncbi:MAG: hypothetical protein GW938_04170 [Leptospira sp.]|nr:hypothetical protein [Leptospira sp.]NCS92335.1 hypothetical protein [Leptospira sp.]